MNRATLRASFDVSTIVHVIWDAIMILLIQEIIDASLNEFISIGLKDLISSIICETVLAIVVAST